MSGTRRQPLKRTLLRHSLAVGAALLALLVRLALKQLGHDLPTYITFYPAVMAVAVFAGVAAGLTSTAASALLVWYWILPRSGLHLTHTSDVVALVLFVGMGVFMSLVAERYRRSRAQAAAYEKELALRETEEELRKVNRTLTALNHSNQALLHANDEAELLDAVCRIVTEDCGHAMVWIGYAEHGAERSVRPVAHAGFDEGYLQSLRITWGDSDRGRGPTGTAIRTGRPCMCANILTDFHMQPWREEALRRGYGSSLALPLIAEGETLGAITIYARKTEAFSTDEVDRLSELANNVAYGINSLRLRAAHAQAEQALRESERRVRTRLESILSPEGDIGDLELADIIDMHGLQELMEQFHTFAQLPMAIIDLRGNVLVGVGWQKICTRFHRLNPESCRHCVESDVELSAGVPPGEFKLYQCKNHMWDVATPIVVGGKHVGNVFTGQFFFEGETPDRETFRAQARHYGFEEAQYLAALHEVPHLSRERLKAMMAYLMNLAEMISRLSYSNIKLARSLMQREELTRSLQANEARLQRERDLLQTVMDGARRSHLVFLDRDFNFVRVNETYAHNCGYAPEAMIGKNHFALYPHAENEAIFTRVRDTGEPVEFHDKPFVFPDQPERGITYWDWTLLPVKDERGKVSGLVFSLIETTERKRAEEALRQSEEQVRVAAMAAEIGIWSWIPGTGHVVVSANWRRLFGIAPDVNVTFDTWRNALHRDDRERAVRELNAASELQREFNCEYRVVRPDGTVRWIVDRGRASYDEAGRALRMAGINLDITELKGAQEALIRSEKLASVGRMAATMAHEINNPLAAVMNTLFLARASAGSAEQVTYYLDIADEELKRVAHLTRQSLGFYRESSAPTALRLTDVLDSAVDLLKAKTRSRGMHIQKECRPDVSVTGVPGELRQVFTNLLANSLDAISEGGTVKVRVSPTLLAGRHAVRITFADNGSGIKAAALPNVFDAFFTTKDTAGTGLGLWVSKQIVEKHGGSIRVRSRTAGAWRGTTFSLVLPGAIPQFLARRAAASA